MTVSHPRCLIRLSDRKLGPRPALRIARYSSYPRIFRMASEKTPGTEIGSARVSDRSPEAHLLCHSCIGDFGIDRPPGIELAPIPFRQTRRFDFDVPAQSVSRTALPISDDVVMICFKAPPADDIDLAAILVHQLVPPAMASIGRVVAVARIKARLFTDSLFVDREVGPDVVPVFGAFDDVVLDSVFEPGDLAGLTVADEPVIGITAIWVIGHDLEPIVDGIRILNGSSNPIELGQTCGVESFELRDRRLGRHEAGVGDIEIISGMNESGECIHEDSVSGRGLEIDHQVPVAADQVIDPVVMAYDDLAVARPATGCDERRARWRRRLVKLGVAEASL